MLMRVLLRQGKQPAGPRIPSGLPGSVRASQLLSARRQQAELFVHVPQTQQRAKASPVSWPAQSRPYSGF